MDASPKAQHVALTKRNFKIEVTAADIQRAQRNDSYKCVVAQAIARIIPDAHHIEVDTQTVRFTRGSSGERLAYLTPGLAQMYVIAFDAGDPVEPFGFSLRAPIRVKRRVKTATGRVANAAYQKTLKAAQKIAAPTTPEHPVGEAPGAIFSTPPTDPYAEAREAYAEARKASAPGATTTISPGLKATPRVFKKKVRAYGQRVLRINRPKPEVAP